MTLNYVGACPSCSVEITVKAEFPPTITRADLPPTTEDTCPRCRKPVTCRQEQAPFAADLWTQNGHLEFNIKP